jgi:hypothetical protein
LEGKTPLRREILNILHKGYFKIDAPSLTIWGLIPSGPIALDISRTLSKSTTADSVILILFSTYSDSDKIFGRSTFASSNSVCATKKLLNNSHFILLS